MNKGLEISQNKKRKKLAKANSIKPEQENIIRFVDIKEEKIERINGKYKHTGSATYKGLQIKNKVYLPDGKYKLVNRKTLKITKKYDGIPEWASGDLADRYKSGL